MLPTLTESGHPEMQKKQEGKMKHSGGEGSSGVEGRQSVEGGCSRVCRERKVQAFGNWTLANRIE